MTTRASAYVKQKRLCIMGVEDTQLGPIPFAVSVKINDQGKDKVFEIPDGPVNTNEEMLPPVADAMMSAEQQIKKELGEGRIKLAAESLVLRARQGDQNAMAMLGAVKQNAERGNERAIFTLKYLKDFVKMHKPEKVPSFGLDMMKSTDEHERNAAIVTYGPTLPRGSLFQVLVNGPDLTITRDQLCCAIEPAFQPTFILAYRLCNDVAQFMQALNQMSVEEKYIARLGFVTGKAHKLQQVRKGANISVLSPLAGWELGE